MHNAEHLVFLVIGYLFWRQIFGSDPNRYRLHPALQFGYLFLPSRSTPSPGSRSTGASHELFPAYLRSIGRGDRAWSRTCTRRRHHVGRRRHPHALADDPGRLGWMHREERRAVRIDRQLDAMFPERRSLAAAANDVE